VHDWQPVEVALEADAADSTSTCTRCGALGFEAGQGRSRRPELPEILYTTGELDALTQQRDVAGPSPA
jgi:hypothetical protein